jgi:cobalt-precorrin 5A hydrolase/precorrin-3B C17-methyltransferase
MPAGVAVRAIAPLLGHKTGDPAVVCLDEAGQSVIPLLGGHQAGANELARQIAALTGGYAAITTASDVQGKPALDLLGQTDGWRIDSASALTHASACLVNDEPVGVYLDAALAMLRPQLLDGLGQTDNITFVETLDELDIDAYAAGLIISHRLLSDHHQHLLDKSVLYRPPVLVAGIGCKRGVPAAELREALAVTLSEAGLALESLIMLASVDLKADEAGLREVAAVMGVPLQIVESARLALLEPAGFSPSAAQEKFDLPGVAEPCAVLVSGGNLLVPKRSFARCTVAVALKG